MEERFINIHKQFMFNMRGFRRGHLIKTGETSYCFLGEWNSSEDSLNAENSMVEMLDKFRDTLDDQGSGVGVTDFVVGDAVIEY